MDTNEGQQQSQEEAAAFADVTSDIAEVDQSEAEQKAATVEETQTEPPKQEAAPQPLTEARVAELLAQREADMRKQLDRAFGTIGNLQQELNSLRQSAVAAGTAGEITREDVSELANDYPELAEAQLKVLQKIAPKLRGVGGVDEAKVKAEVEGRIQQMQIDALEADHPDWKAVAGSDDFKSWVKALPQDEQATLANTWNARLISRKLDQFKAIKQQPSVETKQPSPRQNRFAAAIQPRSSGGSGNYRDPNSEEAGFASVFA